MSRVSKNSEDFENMDVMHIENLYDQADVELKKLVKEKNKMLKGKKGADFTSASQKESKLAPIEEGIRMLRVRMIFLLKLKFVKIPFHEKLPKDNQFYRHYIQNLQADKMKKNTREINDESNMIFKDAIEHINKEQERASRSCSPVDRRRRVAPF